MSALNSNTIIVPAAVGGSPGFTQVQDSGVFFYCRQASTPFFVRFDTGTIVPFDQGFKRTCPGSPFSSVRFFNYGPNPITVLYYVGDGDVDYLGSNVIRVASTYAKGTDLTGPSQLVAGALANFNGLDGTNIRKQITVQNLDANGNTITVQDANGNAMVTLAAGSPPWLHETSGALIVKNTSAGIVTRIVVAELFYS